MAAPGPGGVGCDAENLAEDLRSAQNLTDNSRQYFEDRGMVEGPMKGALSGWRKDGGGKERRKIRQAFLLSGS